MSEPLTSIDCGVFDSRPSVADQIRQDATPAVANAPKKTRIRQRNPRVQIQEILNSSSALDKEPTNDLSIARMKFLQARLAVLSKMQARERHDRIRKLADELKVVRAENEKLKSELAALATKVAVRPPSAAEIVLEKYAAEKAAKQTGGQNGIY